MPAKSSKYNSSTNILGGLPNYVLIVDYIVHYAVDVNADISAFQFRTQSATSRFKKAVEDCFLKFYSNDHKSLFLSSLASNCFSHEEKLVILYWQIIYCNKLFREITDNVFLRALYSGRSSIGKSDVEAFLKHIKVQCPGELDWSDSTIATSASKYLTMLKKFGLADGDSNKNIHAPHISSGLFAYFIKMAITLYPDSNNLSNPMFRFSFLDNQSIINRLKTIEYISVWDITQIGNEVTITLK